MTATIPDTMKGPHFGPVRSLPLDVARTKAIDAAVAQRTERLAERARRIDELAAKAVAEGQDSDRAYWTMVYDFEMAPSTNGRTMLLVQGIVPVPPQDLVDDAEVHEALWTVVEALAASGVHLLNTDHLTDRQLYARLYCRILDESTHCLPPGGNACEYIDVLHASDIAAGGVGARLDRLLQDGRHPCGEIVAGCRAPVQLAAICDRDRFLPRPR